MSNLTMDGNLAVVGADSPEWVEIPSSSPYPRLGHNLFSPPGTSTLLLSPTPTSTQRTLDLSNINTDSSSPSTQSTNRDNILSDNDPAPVVADSVVPPQIVSLEEWANVCPLEGSDIIAEYKHPEFVQALGKHYKLSQANYLSQQTFEQYAVDTFKVDNTERAEKMKPRTNDRLRLFHIAADPDNRDALNNLYCSRASSIPR